MELGFFMSFARPCVHHAEVGQGWGGAPTSLQVANMALCGAALTVAGIAAICRLFLKALVTLPTVM